MDPKKKRRLAPHLVENGGAGPKLVSCVLKMVMRGAFCVWCLWRPHCAPPAASRASRGDMARGEAVAVDEGPEASSTLRRARLASDM